MDIKAEIEIIIEIIIEIRIWNSSSICEQMKDWKGR